MAKNGWKARAIKVESRCVSSLGLGRRWYIYIEDYRKKERKKKLNRAFGTFIT